MKIQYDSPNPRNVTYYGGSLIDGGVQQYKGRILQRSNISNDNEVLAGVMSKGTLHNLSSGSIPNPEHLRRPSREGDMVSPIGELAQQTIFADAKDDDSLEDHLEAMLSAKDTGVDAAQTGDDDDETSERQQAEAKRSSSDDRFLSMLKESHRS